MKTCFIKMNLCDFDFCIVDYFLNPEITFFKKCGMIAKFRIMDYSFHYNLQ